MSTRVSRGLSMLLLTGCTSVSGSDGQNQGQLGDQPASGGHKYALVVGGASSIDTPMDMFGPWIVRETAALDALGYTTTVLFSDGLGDCPAQDTALAQLARRPGGTPEAFTAESFQRELARLVARAGSGDEVLIAIATHGFACSGWLAPPGTDTGGAEDFCVALGAPKPDSGYAEFHFDDLKPYLAQLETKGAWTGLLVSTCDAGNSLRVAGARTCVISATGYETSRRTAFFESWLDHTTGGMTLHDAYHAALPYTNDYEQCQMACPEDGTKLCSGPCSYYDTPWLSSEQGYAAAPCDRFIL